MEKETFSKSTFRGVLIFAFVLIVLFLLPDIIRFYTVKEQISISYFSNATQEKIKQLQRNQRPRYQRNHFEKKSKFKAPPAKFDPNNYSLEEWMHLGLSEKQAAIVIKFTKYPLRSNDDLKRIFVINEDLFQLIKDSTVYSTKPANNWIKEPIQNEKNVFVLVELNTATVEELQQIKGIGAFFAKQIIKKRDELGGFYSTLQLLEVWKVDEEKLAQWSPSLTVNSSKIQLLHLNTANASDLQIHPYISWNLANSIVKLRLQNGPFKKIEDIKQSALMTNELFEQLKRYLTL
jgi:competence protein ComEA